MTRLVWVVLTVVAVGCGGGTQVVGAGMGDGELVTCRKLGGGSVFVEYDSGNGGSRTVVQGVPKDGKESGGLEAEVVSKASKKARRANGWSDQAVNDLITMPDDNETARNFGYEGTDAQLDAKRRSLRDLLDKMPSCLEEARGVAPSDG